MSMDFDDLLNAAAGSDLAKIDSNALPSSVAGEITKASAGESLVQMFDRTKQTIFCIDVSYSQAGAIAQHLKEVDYNWPDNFEEYCRKLRAQYFVRQEARDAVKRGARLESLPQAQQTASHYVVPRVFADMKDGEESKWREMYAKSGLGVGNLATSMHVMEFEDSGNVKLACWTNPPVLKPAAARMIKNKLDAIKTAGTLIIEKRFAKYGKSTVSVLLFSDDVYVYKFPYAQYGDNGLSVRDAAILRIKDANLVGGTDIMKALRAAIQIAADSGQKGHHVLLCTDGADLGAAAAMDLLPDCQKHGIMLDFILVLGIHEEEEADQARDALTKLCLHTNGAFQTVTSEEEMILRLTDAHTRLALPPAPPKLSDGKGA